MSILKSKVGKGEPLVWLTSMGLSIGLIMVIALMSLIVYRGFKSFWPQAVLEVELNDGEKYLGSLRQIREKNKAGREDQSEIEWQLFIGNKDVYGEAFLFFDENQVSQTTTPEDVVILERLEYGHAIAFPLKIKLNDGSVINNSSDKFENTFSDLVAQASQRWEEIKYIEKSQIGSINRELDDISIEEKVIERESLLQGKDASEVIKELDQRKTELNKKYELLAAQAKVLRNKQNDNELVYTLVNGDEKEITFGNIVDFYYPNRLGFLGRVGHFFHSVWNFLSTDPREANTEGGVFPALFGTFVMTILMSLVVTPFGVLAAIYLREYAKQGTWVRLVRIAVNNLAGVPSIVFGVFGLGFFVYFVGGTVDDLFFKDRLPTPTFGTGGLLWASLTLALMTVPVVIVATEEALASVTRGLREASLACGASKWQTISRVVLPAAAPGVLTGMVLAMARGAGEVAPLMLVGVVKLAPTLPLNSIAPYIHLDQKFMHLGFYIYDLGFQSPDSEAAIPMVFAATLLLICLVVFLNLGAIFIRERLRRKYATGAF